MCISIHISINYIFVHIVLSNLFATLVKLMHLCFNNISPLLVICRYGESNYVKREIPSHLHPTWGIRGENCDSVCARASQRCNPDFSSIINRLFCLPSYVFKHSFPAVSDRPSFLNSAAAMCLNVLDAAYLAAVNRTFLIVFFEYGFLHASSGILALICPI